MKKYKILGLITGIVFSAIATYAVAIAGKDVSYDNTNSSLSATTVQGAIDELYEKSQNCSKCSIETGKVYNFSYTGNYQKFEVPCDGNYKVELWGASGGHLDDIDSMNSGKGGYTSGKIDLVSNESLYVYVGESGKIGTNGVDSTKTLGQGAAATFNGGGAGGTAGGGDYPYSAYNGGNSGGGATDIRYFGQNVTPSSTDLKWNSSNGLGSRIMVAGAGGGYDKTTSNGIDITQLGGNNLGLTGQKGTGVTSYLGSAYTAQAGDGGTQTGGYSFGIGGRGSNTGVSGYCNGHSGGGGGYYGGYGANHTNVHCFKIGGGGGSSYISGYKGSLAITSSSDLTPVCTSTTDVKCSYHYSKKIFTDTIMIAGNQSMTSPKGSSETGHLGDGYARITYLG